MKKVLIVYYSRGGNTEKAAVELAKSLNADVEKLIDYKHRKGFLGYIISGKDALFKKLTLIEPVKSNPWNYDLVILATPTWAATMTPALRTYMQQRKDELKQVAFMVTQGGECDGKIYKEMGKVLGKTPIAVVDIGRKEFKQNTWKKKIKEFVSAISK
jgi:flavodoxin